MNSKHLVDPELAPLLDTLPSFPLNRENLPQIRAASRAAASDSANPDIEVTEYKIPGPEGGPEVRVLVHVPTSVARPLPVLVWIHGGGYIMGSADNEGPVVTNFITRVGCAVVVVDYRLAPETPFPGPVEDCYAALKWTHANAEKLGFKPERIAIGGSSAGAGLCAGLALLNRDRDNIPLAYQLLIHPMLDDRTAVTTDPHPYTGEFIWTRQSNYFGWEALLGQTPGGENVSPYAAAARAKDLAGLPPTFISVGGIDLFVDEDMEYARRLNRAGVPTEFHLYPGGYHGFNMVATAQITQRFMGDVMNALKRALNP